MPQIVQAIAVAAVTLGTGAAAMSFMNEDVPDLTVPAGAWTNGGELDGRTFDILGHVPDSSAVLEDELIFQDGTLMSVDCQEYCDFGWNAYQTKVIDGVIHFTASMLCPDAPHTVVWYGQVVGDEITLEFTWTTRRWYWTNQIEGTATGTLVAPVGASVSG